MRYQNRRDAGQRLGEILRDAHLRDPVVLALPRGGVPVAFEVAQALAAPLEIFVSRKIGAPRHKEFGIGAIAEGGVTVFDKGSVAALGLGPAELQQLAAAEGVEVGRRVAAYRKGRPLPVLAARDVILVDDGLATGVTAEAALRSLKGHSPGRLVLAVPVCASQTRDRMASTADVVVCAMAPASFLSVGSWYQDFSQTTDDEVERLMGKALDRPLR
jgi:putative phosphoribosyl transferase